jgi:hypothetical protein
MFREELEACQRTQEVIRRTYRDLGQPTWS